MNEDQIEFTNAFNNQRVILAGFASCSNKEELDIVRDGFYLGLAHDLQLFPDGVKAHMIMDSSVAISAGTVDGFRRSVESARTSDGWTDMIRAVKAKAQAVGANDLDEMWRTLEQGRLQWLSALNAAHPIKTTLLEALQKDAEATQGDVSDAKMIWMYSLAMSIPELQEAVDAWQTVVGMKDKTRPLLGYNPTLWDPRTPEWEPIDLGAQAAAERGGSSIEEAWTKM